MFLHKWCKCVSSRILQFCHTCFSKQMQYCGNDLRSYVRQLSRGSFWITITPTIIIPGIQFLPKKNQTMQHHIMTADIILRSKNNFLWTQKRIRTSKGKRAIHYENMPIQILLKILRPKTEKFSYKKVWYFSYFCSKQRLWILRTASMRRF